MIRISLPILGLISCLLAFTLFSPFTFFALAGLYALSLYLLFYSTPLRAYPFLCGLTLGTELFGTAHLGQATLLALCSIFLHYLFGQQLRFTSIFSRYIVALLITFLIYTLLLFSWQTFFSRLIPLSLFYIATCVITYLTSHYNETQTDEFI